MNRAIGGKTGPEKKDCLYLLVTKAYLSEYGKASFYLKCCKKKSPLRRCSGGSKVIAKCQHWNVTDFNLNNSTLQYLKPAHLLQIWIWNIDPFRFGPEELRGWQQTQYFLWNPCNYGFMGLFGFQCQIWKFIQKKKTLRYAWRIYTSCCTVFKCLSTECILTRRCSPSSNPAYQCLVTKINMTMNWFLTQFISQYEEP